MLPTHAISVYEGLEGEVCIQLADKESYISSFLSLASVRVASLLPRVLSPKGKVVRAGDSAAPIRQESS